MRQENSATDIAIAAPVPFALRANWVGATRRVIAIAFLRRAFGVIWSAQAALRTTDLGAAITYGLLFLALPLFETIRRKIHSS